MLIRKLAGLFLIIMGLLLLVWAILLKQLPEYPMPYLEGVYPPEKNESFSYRWTTPEWALRFDEVVPGSYRLKLTLMSLQPGPVRISDAQGVQLAIFTPATGLQEYSFEIPSGLIFKNQLKLSVNTTPYKNISARDNRELGVILQRVELVPAPLPLLPSLPPIFNLLSLGMGVILLLSGYYFSISDASGKQKVLL
jgi:hypothetical protein